MLSKIFFILISLFIMTGNALAKNSSLSVNFESFCSQEEAKQKDRIQSSGVVKDVINHLNEEFSLPQTIKVKFICSDADEYGPYYDPETKEVIFPYFFRYYVQTILKENGYSDDEERHMISDDVVLHTLYHEIGHALVDILDLPITGKEEDAVDELSTLMLLSSYESGDKVAISAGDFFDLESLEFDEITEDQLFGLHSLDEQRFFNILCLVYGSDPDRHQDLFEGLDVNQERVEACIDDFESRYKAWNNILTPYKK